MLSQEDKENIEVIEACNYGESTTLWLLRQYFTYRTVVITPQRAYAHLLKYIQEQITKGRDATAMNRDETITTLSRLVERYAILTHSEELDNELSEKFPDIWQRVMPARRERMIRQWNLLKKLGRLSQLGEWGGYYG